MNPTLWLLLVNGGVFPLLSTCCGVGSKGSRQRAVLYWPAIVGELTSEKAPREVIKALILVCDESSSRKVTRPRKTNRRMQSIVWNQMRCLIDLARPNQDIDDPNRTTTLYTVVYSSGQEPLDRCTNGISIPPPD